MEEDDIIVKEEGKSYVDVTDKKFKMDNLLRRNLNFLIKAVQRKWDGLILLDGIEGSGKTTLASQIGYYLSHQCKKDFDLINVVFTGQEFEEAVNTLPPTSVIQWDEAIFGTMAMDWANLVNRTITKLLVTMRKKQLFTIIVVPYLYMLQPYLAVARSRVLIHVTTPDGIQRGSYRFYDYVGKQRLYYLNKKYYTYYKVDPAFYGHFRESDNVFYDQEEYDKKKDDAILSLSKDHSTTSREKLWRDRCIMTWKAMVDDENKKYNKYEFIARACKMNPKLIRHNMREYGKYLDDKKDKEDE